LNINHFLGAIFIFKGIYFLVLPSTSLKVIQDINQKFEPITETRSPKYPGTNMRRLF